jgi:hypothetical protein
MVRDFAAVGHTEATRTLDLPIPAIATNGTLKIKTVAGSHKFGRKINAGSKIVVKTGATYYAYYSLADIAVKNFDEVISIPVSPPIQAVHAEFNDVELPSEKYHQRIGETVIGPMLSSSVGSSRLYADALYVADTDQLGTGLPYVRDWPDTNDPLGVPWGQSDLLALSFFPPNGGSHRETGDAYAVSNIVDSASGLTYQFWGIQDVLPVPRILSAAYTHLTRRAGARYRVNEFASKFAQRDDYFNDFERHRTATGNHWRVSSFGPFPHDRYVWQPSVQLFGNRLSVTNSFSGTGGSLAYDPGTGYVNLVAAMNNGLSNRWAGSRGGYYSLSGYASGPSGTCGFSLEIWTTNPGGSDIKLLTAAVPDGSGGPVRVSGTWTDLRLPTNEGTCGVLYAKAYPTDPTSTGIFLHDTRGPISIFATGNIPWCYSIVTGNLVAPGGLIAPFY